MTVTHKIQNMELTDRGRPYQIHAKQGDSNTRNVEIRLYANNTPFQPPDGTNFVVRFLKQDGTSGMYDTMPDGSTPAVTANGNVIVVNLAEQVLTCPGQVMCDVAMLSGLDVLGTFDFVIIVDKSPESGTDTSSQPYYKVTSLDALNATLDGKLDVNQGSGNAGKFLGIGSDGAVAPVAAPSADGKSAYQYAVEGGYTGTETEFAAKLAEEYLPLSGGTMTGKIVFPSGDQNAGITNSGDIKILGYDSGYFRFGDSGYPLQMRGSGTNPLYGEKLVLLEGDVYSKEEVDAALGAYITDVATLVGGDA